MSDAPAVASPAKKAAAKSKKPKTPAAHPKVSVMVIAAIKTLKERNGSSAAAIKKYIAANYKGIDLTKLNFHINKCLKTGVEKKTFTQTKGTGASGSFKLAVNAEKPAAKKPAKKTAAKKPKTEKKAKKPAAKKTPKKATKPKAATSAKKPAPKKPKAAKKPAAKKPVAKKPAKKTPAKKPAKKVAAKK